MTDLAEFVNRRSLDPEEVLLVFADHFGSASMESGRVRFQRQDVWVDVRMSKRGRITSIQPGPSLISSDLRTIRQKIAAALIVDQKPAVGRRVGFSSKPVDSFYRYRDKFQILPAPVEAPRAHVYVADHPFLLEHTYTWSSYPQVRNRRREHQAQIYLRLLNLLSATRVHGGPPHIRHAWVMPVAVDPREWKSEWRQIGYTYQGLSLESHDFSHVSAYQPMALFSLEPPFSYIGGKGTTLALPDDIDHCLDTALAMPPQERKRFQRALVYLEQSASVWVQSRSLAYVALVMAVESLTSNPKRCESCDQVLLTKGGKCETCGQPVLGATRTFREFLETHAPVVRRDPYIRTRLYRLRSDLAHGSSVMLTDIDPFNVIGEYVREESDLESALSMIAAEAVRGWLRSKL